MEWAPAAIEKVKKTSKKKRVHRRTTVQEQNLDASQKGS